MLGDITSIACVDEDQTRDGGVRRPRTKACSPARRWRPRPTGSSTTTSRSSGTCTTATPSRPATSSAAVCGPLRSILTGERVALNFLCHCSGIATLTRRYVRGRARQGRASSTPARRCPACAASRRAAVRAGGGFNHRDSLSDAVLIKDNHLAALGIAKAVERARAALAGPHRSRSSATRSTRSAEARDAGADVVLARQHDAPTQVARGGRARSRARSKVEVSGGVTLETVGAYAESGADFISVGALTHSVRVFDIGLDISLRSRRDAADDRRGEHPDGRRAVPRRTSSSTTGASRPSPSAPPTSSR